MARACAAPPGWARPEVCTEVMAIDPRTLLERLADGRFHSGETLAGLAGVSRTAIWKQLQVLSESRRLEIHSVRGRGYRLARPIELLRLPLIESAIGAEARAGLDAVEVFDSLASTSAYLADGRENWGAGGRLCLAEQQTAGRGRRGRTWVSPFGANIYLSLYWRFDLPLSALSGLSLASGVAVARALETCGVQGVALKWPNDIHFAERKLGGLLVEGFGPTEGPVAVIIGVGVNVDMPESSGREIDQEWIDLRRAAPGVDVSRNRLAGVLIDELITMVRAYGSGGWPAFRSSWASYDAYLGREVEVQVAGNEQAGVYRGVDAAGGLVLEQAGKFLVFHSGEVSLRVPLRRSEIHG